MRKLREHCARTVLMVRPRCFGFNPQTASDNEFQHEEPQEASTCISQQAIVEFEAAVEVLEQNGLEVLVLDGNTAPGLKTPDELFPNNWFLTRPDGILEVFPMKHQNRQAEVRIGDLIQVFEEAGRKVDKVVDWRELLPSILEGTGVLVFDHLANQVFASYSPRCELDSLEKYANLLELELIACNSEDFSGNPIFHTNVILSIGEGFAVICEEAIVPDAKGQKFLSELGRDRELVNISLDQVHHFCGNVLAVESKDEEKLIIMSQSAYGSYSSEQLQSLQSHGRLVVVPLDIIEKVGGGSIRCMMAEVFL